MRCADNFGRGTLRGWRPDFDFSPLLGVGLHCWKDNKEFRACARTAFHAHIASVCLHDVLHNREAQAGPRQVGGGGEVAREDVRTGGRP